MQLNAHTRAHAHILTRALKLEASCLIASSASILKTFRFAAPSFTDAGWERCWLEWHYRNSWLHYITFDYILYLGMVLCNWSLSRYERYNRNM